MSTVAAAEDTQAAVIVPVHPAEAVVGEHRRRLDLASSWGVPAHVTVLFPFVPPADLTSEVVRALADVVAATSPFECTFGECGWFGEDVLWLAPDPADRFRDLTYAVVERFPAHQPYGGRFAEVVPHLTVGETRCGTTAALRAAEAHVTPKLPVSARLDHALLIAGTDRPDSWHTVAELPFGTTR